MLKKGNLGQVFSFLVHLALPSETGSRTPLLYTGCPSSTRLAPTILPRTVSCPDMASGALASKPGC